MFRLQLFLNLEGGVCSSDCLKMSFDLSLPGSTALETDSSVLLEGEERLANNYHTTRFSGFKLISLSITPAVSQSLKMVIARLVVIMPPTPHILQSER
jgi:hypothetical protein